MSYDFKNLSPYDFEEICRDLLQKELGLRLESFKTGKDKGIDLRYCIDMNRAIIIQCKHYANSTIHDLVTSLKKEVAKLEILRPARYMLCTSLKLSPADKDKLATILGPFLKTVSDIVGLEDLNNMLQRFPEVHQQHFKLWLNSTQVLQSIIHSDVLNRSRFLTESIIKKSSLYVENGSFEEVMKLLSVHHSAIISGTAGVGKTTLAEMILVRYAMSDYEVIALSEMSQAYRIFDPTKKQIFFYDDFLGQTFLQDSRQSFENSEIISFIDKVSKEKNHRFLMTTRELILAQATILNEKIGTSDLSVKKCVVDIQSYTNRIRSRILLNHLYFSDIQKEFKDELIKDKKYLQLIKHRNFNPRIIEWMTSVSRLKEIQPTIYFSTFLKFLENPIDLWWYSFEKISVEAKLLVLTLSSLSTEVAVDDLNNAFNVVYESYAKHFRYTKVPRAFANALKESEGTFIVSNNNFIGRAFKFHSPAVSDFINTFLPQNVEYQKVILDDPVSFQQIRSVNEINNRRGDIVIAKISLPVEKEKIISLLKKDWSSSMTFTKIRFYPEWIVAYWVENCNSIEEMLLMENQFHLLLQRLASNNCDVPTLVRCINTLENEDVSIYFGRRSEVIRLAKVAILENVKDIDDLHAAYLFIHTYSNEFDSIEIEEYESALEHFLKLDVECLIESESNTSVLNDYSIKLTSIVNEFSLDFHGEIESVDERVREIDKEDERASYEPYIPKDNAEMSKDISDDEIATMFEALVE